MSIPVIEVCNLSKIFKLSAKQQKTEQTTSPTKVAVSNLSFLVNEGEVFGLLGPNGAGKTTTLRMLATLVKPDKGDALIKGYSVTKDAQEVRKTIGFLTGDLRLEEVFTPDYLFDFFSELNEIPTATRDARKKELFDRFGINKYAHTKVADLSTGMRQSASLVVSLAHDPQVIIFDEPTNGLDIIASKVVTDFLCDLKAEGKTVLLATHIFSLVEKTCDRVGVILNGHMYECDTLEHVTQGGTLEDAFFRMYAQSMQSIAHEARVG